MGLRDRFFKKSNETHDSENSKMSITEKYHDIFISYSTVDYAIANKICYGFEQNGFKCWIAPRNISSGEVYVDEIEDAILHSKVVVVVLSYNSGKSKYVKNEIRLAFDKDIPIIPVSIDQYIPYDDFGFYLSGYAYLNTYPFSEDKIELIIKRFLNIYGVQLDNSKSNYIESDKRPLPPYEGNDKFIFVSFSSSDSQAVFNDIRKYQDLGYNVWYDDCDSSNEKECKKIRIMHLKQSDLLIVFVTNASMASDLVKKEIKYAVKHNKNIIPIYLEDFDNIEMEDEIDFELSVIQGIIKTTLDEEEYVFKFTEAFDKFGFELQKD